MKFTIGWLKEHLDTKYTDNKIIEKLTDVGLEVESFENINSENGLNSDTTDQDSNHKNIPDNDLLD